jgi:zinc protease
MRPIPSTPRTYQFPQFERRRGRSGVDVITSCVRKLPLVSIVVLMDAGAVWDNAGREGLAVLTSKLLMEGTATREGSALAEAFERLGASVEIEATWDSAMLRLTVLASRLQPALLLLSEVLRKPAFRGRDVARLKSERGAELLQIHADPRRLADYWFERLLYARSSRYAHPEAGDTGSVAAITSTDVEVFYRTHYGPELLTVVIAGDINAPETLEMVDEVFDGWRNEASNSEITPDDIAERQRRVGVVPRAGAPQSEVRIGHRGVPRSHPDHFPLVVVNAVLGGLFSSRINLNLREEHGYTYGAHSAFDWRRHAGPFLISTAVESSVTAAAIAEVIAEVERIRETAIGAEELTLATSYLSGVFPIRYETTAAIANALATLVTYELPGDYFDTYRARVQAVTSTDVLLAARAHLHPDELLIVAVGDVEQIEGPLADMNLGPIIVTTNHRLATGIEG